MINSTRNASQGGSHWFAPFAVDRLPRDLARAENIDKYEVIRRALALYQYLHKDTTEGSASSRSPTKAAR
ncbi:MAG: hypothetical protein ACREA0_08505 [bacterium]